MHGFCRLLGSAGLMVFLLAATSVTPAHAQWTPDRLAADESELPRTPWGDPDLQGMWNNSTTTPLERLTSEEQALGRQAQQAVIDATRGTGAGWLEQAGQTRARLAAHRPTRRAHPDDRAGGAAPHRPRERSRRPWRGRFVARPQQLGALHLTDTADRDDSDAVQRQLPDPADTRSLRAGHGDDPRGAHRPAGRAAPRLPAPSANGWETPAGTGRATRWSSRRCTSTAGSTAATTSRRTSPRPGRAGRGRPCG